MAKAGEVAKSGGQIAKVGFFASSLNGLQRVAHVITRSVVRMPDLEKPVYDDSRQLGKCSAVDLSLYSWSYAYRKLEYAVDFTGKGFAAWVKLLLSIVFFLGIPLFAIWMLIKFVGQFASLADVMASVAWSVSLLIIALFVLGALGYVLYAVISILRGKPITVYKPTFDIRSPEKGAVPTVKIEDPIDVEVDEESQDSKIDEQ